MGTVRLMVVPVYSACSRLLKHVLDKVREIIPEMTGGGHCGEPGRENGRFSEHAP